MVNLEAEDRKQLITLLKGIPEMATERSRRQILVQANLGKLVPKIDLSGAPFLAVSEILSYLSNYGRLTPEHEVLGLFLKTLKDFDFVGIEQQEFLDTLLTKYEMMTPIGGRKELFNVNQVTINYQDFQVLVDKNNKIRASSEQGDVSGELRLEKNEIDLTLKLIESTQTNSELLKALGDKLYQALFPKEIDKRFHATIAGAQANNNSVRLRLIFESPELAALPWEFLYERETNIFLANNTETVLSRYIDVPLLKRDIKVANLPLKILLVISTPNDLNTLDVNGEEQIIREALEKQIKARHIELDVLKEATIRNINQKLREKSYDVFHFIGHGVFKDNKGKIILVDRTGRAKYMDDESFANFFLGNRNVGLVVLNSCQGATISSNQAFVGTAPNLVRRGVPAVVAMQYSILDTTATLFSDEFYRTLALGYPIDTAIQTTRNAMSQEIGLDKRDFATPTLYMRAKDGVILSGL